LAQKENKTRSKRVMSANSAFEDLRMQIRALEGHGFAAPKAPVIAFADHRLNTPFQHRGLTLGALHEFCAAGVEAELASAVTAFSASVAGQILRKRKGFLLWAASRNDCYAPGLISFGLDPARIVWVECRKDAEVLSVMEEALESRALAAVLGEAGALSLKAGRRLDAAARRSGVAALLLRRRIFKSNGASEGPSGAAATRWRIRALPSETSGEPGLGPPRWRLDLEYCRNGRTASWIVEASHGFSDGTDKAAGHVRVVAELRDDAGAAETASARPAARTVGSR
jgi:hypothetical protein